MASGEQSVLVHAPCLAADLTPLPSRYVVSDVSLECGTARHAKFSVLAWILLVAFSLGFPLISFLQLFRYRNRLHEPKVQRRLLFLYSGVL